jgi:hypothetical protein
MKNKDLIIKFVLFFNFIVIENLKKNSPSSQLEVIIDRTVIHSILINVISKLLKIIIRFSF